MSHLLYSVGRAKAVANLKARGEWPSRQQPAEEAETDYYVLAAFEGDDDGLARYLQKRVAPPRQEGRKRNGALEAQNHLTKSITGRNKKV